MVVDDIRIKVEFVAEARFTPQPGEAGPLSDTPWATTVDCYTAKLLANSDRFADDAYLSRDLIDLAALRLHAGPVPELAWTTAAKAYGICVANDLVRSTTEFLRRTEHRDRCFSRLLVTDGARLLAAVEQLRVEGEAQLGR